MSDRSSSPSAPAPDDAPRPSTAAGPSTIDGELLDLGRTRDLQGRAAHPWFRRLALTAMVVLVGVALAGGFGQPTRVTQAAEPGARLDLRAPSVLRGGLLWHARITVRAWTQVREPQLILGPGYVSGMQLNTVEPAPSEETSRGDSIALSYATLQPGDQLTVYLQLQVNPSTVGRQDLSVVLEGRGARPVRLPASVTVLP